MAAVSGVSSLALRLPARPIKGRDSVNTLVPAVFSLDLAGIAGAPRRRL
jgi:hypothetical protein